MYLNTYETRKRAAPCGALVCSVYYNNNNIFNVLIVAYECVRASKAKQYHLLDEQNEKRQSKQQLATFFSSLKFSVWVNVFVCAFANACLCEVLLLLLLLFFVLCYAVLCCWTVFVCMCIPFIIICVVKWNICVSLATMREWFRCVSVLSRHSANKLNIYLSISSE